MKIYDKYGYRRSSRIFCEGYEGLLLLASQTFYTRWIALSLLYSNQQKNSGSAPIIREVQLALKNRTTKTLQAI
jgi:hypothetical protein